MKDGSFTTDDGSLKWQVAIVTVTVSLKQNFQALFHW